MFISASVFNSANIEVNLRKKCTFKVFVYISATCSIFFFIKLALRLNINYPSTIDVSPVILSQTCASLCRTIIVITSSGSDNDNVYLWL